jgi:hypothetical protein
MDSIVENYLSLFDLNALESGGKRKKPQNKLTIKMSV